MVRGHEYTVGLSVGVTTSGSWHEHADEVLREANQALLYAKKRGRARIEIYNPRLDRSATVADLKLERSLRAAIADRDGFIPYFQPVMSLTDDDGFIGYEALVRWMHPTRGPARPGPVPAPGRRDRADRPARLDDARARVATRCASCASTTSPAGSP